MVIVADVVLNSFKKFRTIIGGMQVDVIVLDGFPEPLDPHIVQGSAFAIHGYPGFEVGFYISSPFDTGVLATLIRVYDLGLSISGDGVCQNLHTPRGFHGVADAPLRIRRL